MLVRKRQLEVEREEKESKQGQAQHILSSHHWAGSQDTDDDRWSNTESLWLKVIRANQCKDWKEANPQTLSRREGKWRYNLRDLELYYNFYFTVEESDIV